jgi:VanZ family protein
MTARRRRPRETGADASSAIVTRFGLAAAAAAFAVLAVYASLIPFDATPLSAGTAWTLIVASWPPTVTSKTDFVANLLLQFPFGFLLTGAIALKPSRRNSFAVVASTVAAAFLALGVEWAQGMVAARTPSLTDVVAEAIGALAGALVWIRCGPWLTAFVNAAWRSSGSRALVPLGAYVMVWVLGRWSPFDFTLRLPELAQKFRAGLLVLWPGAPGAEGLAATIGSSAGQWLLAVPLGVVARIVLRRGRMGYRTSAAVLGAGSFALAVELGKIFVLSRGVDLGDVAAAGLGAASGVWWVAQPESDRGRAVGHFVLATLLLYAWSPFHFALEPRPFGLLLFGAYHTVDPFQALGEALLKVQLGFVVGLVVVPVTSAAVVWRVAPWIVVFGLIEIGQMFVPERYPDVTDVLLSVVGVVLGSASRATLRREGAAGREALRANTGEIV